MIASDNLDLATGKPGVFVPRSSLLKSISVSGENDTSRLFYCNPDEPIGNARDEHLVSLDAFLPRFESNSITDTVVCLPPVMETWGKGIHGNIIVAIVNHRITLFLSPRQYRQTRSAHPDWEPVPATIQVDGKTLSAVDFVPADQIENLG